MPIYAYRCAACGHDFDRLQKLSDPDPEACPACAADAVKRQLTAPAFRLSGSGWYETDFKRDGEKKRNLVEGGEGAAKPEPAPAADAKAPAAKTDGAAAKPDAKPAPAAAAKPAPAASA
ncbi:FmdB family zinc ribbon protein [Luteimonas sp. R10]|uniref:FmdB family zinc ribbon protein n=1 Tax=Luteimonas sp. R10 TaxID=3108176 RepID=UPI003084BE60|nr:zinc ribbon domain-containing protein [Luteimonas sp. R10]